MDKESFKQQLADARRVDVPIAGAVFRLEMPTEHAMRVAVEANTDIAGRLMSAQVFREVLKSAVIGWEGVKTTHILPDAPAEMLPFSAEALVQVLDGNQSIADELTAAIGENRKARREKLEAARKNL